jgi:prepilin-type processing-associated H-X9-DG protein
MMKFLRSRRPGAFTLIELLVVIAIMMLLLGLLAPGLANARNKARLAACTSNLKQLGLAISMYCDDNNGRIAGLSGTYPTWTNTSPPFAWSQLIYPYTKNHQLFKDPGWPAWMPDLPVSYYLNLLPACLASNETVNAGQYYLDLRALKHPSAFILLSEDLFVSPQQEIDPTNETSDRTGFSGLFTNLPPIHPGGRSNFLFADGHVESFDKWNPDRMTYWFHTMANWNSTVP